MNKALWVVGSVLLVGCASVWFDKGAERIADRVAGSVVDYCESLSAEERKAARERVNSRLETYTIQVDCGEEE